MNFKQNNGKIDWQHVPVGSKFTCEIEGTRVEGKIQKNAGIIYLCQNVKDGAGFRDKLGYEYSWVTFEKNNIDIENCSVTNLEIHIDDKPKRGDKVWVSDASVRQVLRGKNEKTFIDDVSDLAPNNTEPIIVMDEDGEILTYKYYVKIPTNYTLIEEKKAQIEQLQKEIDELCKA